MNTMNTIIIAEKLLDVKNAEFPPFRVQNYNYFREEGPYA